MGPQLTSRISKLTRRKEVTIMQNHITNHKSQFTIKQELSFFEGIAHQKNLKFYATATRLSYTEARKCPIESSNYYYACANPKILFSLCDS